MTETHCWIPVIETGLFHEEPLGSYLEEHFAQESSGSIPEKQISIGLSSCRSPFLLITVIVPGPRRFVTQTLGEDSLGAGLLGKWKRRW